MRNITIFLFGLIICSCKQSDTEQQKTVRKDTIAQTVNQTDTREEIAKLLGMAKTADTLEMNNQFEPDQPFLFFKSGLILGGIAKNALAVSCPAGNRYVLKLYLLQADSWQLSDSIDLPDAVPAQFSPVFADYNFDGQTDLFIQVSASGGWSLSRGHLLTIDPATKKFSLHKETRDFANMSPDKRTMTVKTEQWNGYDRDGNHQLTIFTNKWEGGLLKTISRKDVVIHAGI